MPFITAFSLTLILSMLVAKFLGPLGWMDHPGGRRIHNGSIARTGGIALLLACILGHVTKSFISPFSNFEHFLLLITATTGIIDDKLELRPRWKAAVGLLVAAGLAWQGATELVASGRHLLLFGTISLPCSWMTYFLMYLAAYWSIPQGLNLVDGANGLAIGYGAIILGILWLAGNPQPYLLGTLTGLLLLNWPKAKHFLGDCGALTLGILLAILANRTFGSHNPTGFFWLFAYPAVDVSMVILIRAMNGRPLGEGDRNHLHHQLQDRFPQLKGGAVPLLWLLAGSTASGAVVKGNMEILPILGLSTLLAIALSFLLLHRKTNLGTETHLRRSEVKAEIMDNGSPVLEL